MTDTLNAVTTFLSNSGNTISQSAKSTSNSITNTILTPENCKYKSTFIGNDKKIYNIVENISNSVDRVNCICVDDNNNPTDKRAKKYLK